MPKPNRHIDKTRRSDAQNDSSDTTRHVTFDASRGTTSSSQRSPTFDITRSSSHATSSDATLTTQQLIERWHLNRTASTLPEHDMEKTPSSRPTPASFTTVEKLPLPEPPDLELPPPLNHEPSAMSALESSLSSIQQSNERWLTKPSHFFHERSMRAIDAGVAEYAFKVGEYEFAEQLRPDLYNARVLRYHDALHFPEKF